MGNANPIEQLRLQLALLGCPAKAARRIVRETAEHYEDLRRVALTSGLSAADAAAEAAEQLGAPKALAERHIEAIRGRTPWGRSQAVTCAIFIPLFVAPLSWLGAGLACVWLGERLAVDAGQQDVISHALFYLALVVISILFDRMARSAAFNLKWTLIMFGLTSLSAFMTAGGVRPEEVPLYFYAFYLLLVLVVLYIMTCAAAVNWKWMLVMFGATLLSALFLICSSSGLAAAPGHVFLDLRLGLCPGWPCVSRAAIPLLVGVLAYLRHKRDVRLVIHP